jgi:drug/metabolite transporter (DMT)-like permease
MTALRGRTLAMYLGRCIVWGSTWLVIKIGLRDLPPLRFAGLRMALACALLTPFAAAHRGPRATTSERRWIVLTGFLQIGFSYACIFMASQWIPSGLTALLFATFPIFVGLFAHGMLPEERLTPRAAMSALFGLAGVAIIEGPAALRAVSGEARPLLVGSSLVLASALVSGYANVVNKKHMGGVPPPRNVWGQTLVGSAVLLAAATAFERGEPSRWTAGSVGALVYLAVFGTALPFVGLFWLIRRVPVAVVGTIPVVDTVIAVCLGNLVLGETLPPRVLAAGALILLGVLLAALPARGTAARASP